MMPAVVPVMVDVDRPRRSCACNSTGSGAREQSGPQCCGDCIVVGCLRLIGLRLIVGCQTGVLVTGSTLLLLHSEGLLTLRRDATCGEQHSQRSAKCKNSLHGGTSGSTFVRGDVGQF